MTTCPACGGKKFVHIRDNYGPTDKTRTCSTCRGSGKDTKQLEAALDQLDDICRVVRGRKFPYRVTISLPDPGGGSLSAVVEAK